MCTGRNGFTVLPRSRLSLTSCICKRARLGQELGTPGAERKDWTMWRAGLAALLLLTTATAADASSGARPTVAVAVATISGHRRTFSRSGAGTTTTARAATDRALQSGGDKPAIAAIEPRTISFPSSYPVGSIVIDSKGRQLFLVKSATEALHYPISVGREGFAWAGTETISRKAEWPDWHPPEEMRYRDWRLPEKMTGRHQEPARRHGALSRQLALSHPRHQRPQVDRPRRLVGLLPHAQRPHRRSGHRGWRSAPR